VHSAQFQNGRIVFFTGNSGHDVTHDLCNDGAETSMLQRDTTVSSLHL